MGTYYQFELFSLSILINCKADISPEVIAAFKDAFNL